jgi:hypothetical protein
MTPASEVVSVVDFSSSKAPGMMATGGVPAALGFYAEAALVAATVAAATAPAATTGLTAVGVAVPRLGKLGLTVMRAVSFGGAFFTAVVPVLLSP